MVSRSVAPVLSAFPHPVTLTSSPPLLSEADHLALHSAVREIYRATDLAAFPRAALLALCGLVPALFISYNELNLRTGGVVVVVEPEEKAAEVMRTLPLIHQHQAEHPLLLQYQTTGAGDAQAISDFVPWEEWQQRPIYRDVMATIGVGDSLSFAVQGTTRSLIFFVLSRARPDFSPRDRAICNLLRPHLQQAFENAQSYTEARAMAAGAGTTRKIGMLIARADGCIRHANDPALELLDRAFPGPLELPRALPPELRAWLTPQLADDGRALPPFQLACGDEMLRVRLVERTPDGAVLTVESAVERGPEFLMRLGLSSREAEVLFWITQGKSNEHAARILEISTRTVDKHLENIYPKLGVEARGAAMCMAAVELDRAER